MLDSAVSSQKGEGSVLLYLDVRFTLTSHPFSAPLLHQQGAGAPGRTIVLCINVYVCVEESRRDPGYPLLNLEYPYRGNHYPTLYLPDTYMLSVPSLAFVAVICGYNS